MTDVSEPSAAGMVERVARAIDEVANPDHDGAFSEANKRAMARAAIAAMRLPRDHPDESLAGELDAIIDTALAEDTA